VTGAVRNAPERPTAAIGELYDQVGGLVEQVMGGSLHYGYWHGADDSADMREASERMTDLMVEKLGAHPGDRILDVGCGNGRPALRLASASGASVLGVNIAPGQVATATGHAERESMADRVRFAVADAGNLRLTPGSFDGAWLFESLLHMPDERAVLRGIHAALRPGARLVIANLVLLAPLAEERVQQLRPLWQTFQIASIRPLASYQSLLDQCGFATAEILDVTPNSVPRTMQTILGAQAGLRVEGLEEPLALVNWLAETTEAGYAIVVAVRRPDDASTRPPAQAAAEQAPAQ
jgi:cyclopropane fatty-acyl-phospholipid synthase-like methyltransferase